MGCDLPHSMAAVTELAAEVNRASAAMWHAQMIVDGAARPSPKVLAERDRRMKAYKTACAAWAAAYFAD